MIRTNKLGKKYDHFWAVQDLNLNLRAGEIYGFLGPNGAGKTTTILMILAILRPSAGEFFLFGNETGGSNLKMRRKIGVVSEKQYLYPEMTMREYLDFFGEIYRVRNPKTRREELAEKVELTDVLDKRLGTFSRGMQQKVGFVRALLHDPELLILDEPVSGLDPMGIRQARGLIEEENQRGKTVFISSHLLSEIEKLCHRVGIMNKGRLSVQDTMDNLVRRLSAEIKFEVELADEKQEAADALDGLDFVSEISSNGRFLNLKMKTDRDYRRDVVQALMSHGHVPVGIRTDLMTLEEAFIAITTENISLLATADT
jgi:ABC-type multidrug transport system ATPase subunit